MRRNYISPEYEPAPVRGTFNMVEESTYFSSKMLKIVERIYIDNMDILWHENQHREQVDIEIEQTTNPLIYSPSMDKDINSKLHKEITPDLGLVRANTTWFIDIDTKEILTNYIFASMKTNRTFEDVKNSYTKMNSVNSAIKSYIINNVLNRYKLTKVDLYIKNRSIGENAQLQYNNTWDPNLGSSNEYLISEYGQEYIDESILRIKYNQMMSNKYTFDYYYNLEFTRI